MVLLCVCVCVDGGGRKQTAGGTDIEQGRTVYIHIFFPCETLAHTHTWTTHKLTHSLFLSHTHRPGSFLVRPSEKTPGDYALAFRTATEVRHWKLVQDGGKFYVHPRPNPYNSLEEIIQVCVYS